LPAFQEITDPASIGLVELAKDIQVDVGGYWSKIQENKS